MSCLRCDGTGFVIVDAPGGVSAARRCECLVEAITIQRAEYHPGLTPLTPEAAGVIIDSLCDALPFSPAGPGRWLLAGALYQMCETQEQAEWVAARAVLLYAKWPGMDGLRQILCSRYMPKDGYLLSYTEAYPDGIPSEKPTDPLLLPPGHIANVDPTAERLISAVADSLDMGRREQVEPASQPQPHQKQEGTTLHRVFTAADIEKAMAEKPDRSEQLISEARQAIADPSASKDRKEIAREILRGFGVEEAS